MKRSKTKTDPHRTLSGDDRETAEGRSAGSRILAAIEEATGILRTEGIESPRIKVSTYGAGASISGFRTGDVRRVRTLLGTTQEAFARFLGVNLATLRSWEGGKRLPQPIARRFLAEIEANPEYWRDRINSREIEHGS